MAVFVVNTGLGGGLASILTGYVVLLAVASEAHHSAPNRGSRRAAEREDHHGFLARYRHDPLQPVFQYVIQGLTAIGIFTL